ncbi:MAG: LA2681 family HEPN domain-containing protein [Candidatus Thiodiazotropha endolucinida]
MEYDEFNDFSQLKLNELLSLENINDLDNRTAFDLVGKIIDLSDFHDRPEGTQRALELCDELAQRALGEREMVLLHYFRANAWASRRKTKHNDAKAAWAWGQPEILRELFHLRNALRHSGFKQLDKVRRCQVLTNAANLLNTLGRCTEAIEYWNRALDIIPHFGMALGNRGYGYMSYARTLYDQGNAIAMMKFAHDDLRQATAFSAFFESPGYEEVKEAMVREADDIAAHIDLEKVTASLELENYSLGRSKGERAYRYWCLERRLFLTPLNDLGPYPIAARDILTLPNLVLGVGEPPTLIAFFNQLKQEYVAARYLYYEGTREGNPHFADRGVLLYDTLDYPAYSLAVEQVKAVYRMAYSIFDKLAYFINAYWRLDMEERSINFRSVWYTTSKKGKTRTLRDCFIGYENWPLRGLFWLSKDLLEQDTELADTMEPDAVALNTIRNHLEHKYLKVHDWPWTSERDVDAIHDSLRDSLAYSVARGDLEAKSLRLLKLARAGLIYLSLAVHREEQLRAEQRGDGLVMPMELDTWPDDWKR